METYNANLANGLGNLTSRVLKMAANASIKYKVSSIKYEDNKHLDRYQLQEVMDDVWKKIQACDEFIQKTEPFKVIKTDPDKARKDIEHLLSELHQLAFNLQPFLPQTSEKILEALKNPKEGNIPRLFPRVE